MMRRQIYKIFGKVAKQYSLIMDDKFNLLLTNNQYSKLEDVKSNIASNIGKKFLEKAVEGIKNLEKNIDKLSVEQQALIADSTGAKAITAFTTSFAKQLREELYSRLVKKGLTSGLASLDTFKGFDRDRQFEELKNVKPNIKFGKRTLYSGAIKAYKTAEKVVLGTLNSTVLKTLIGAVDKIISKLQEWSS